jgi:hypothetical protein
MAHSSLVAVPPYEYWKMLAANGAHACLGTVARLSPDGRTY